MLIAQNPEICSEAKLKDMAWFRTWLPADLSSLQENHNLLPEGMILLGKQGRI